MQQLVKIEYLPNYDLHNWGSLAKASPFSAGYDVRAAIKDTKVLPPNCRMLIPLGIKAEMPAGMEMQIRARSGLALRNGIMLVNGIGTIDADYRGEIGVVLYNSGTESFTIEPGSRVAQIVFNQLPDVNLQASNVSSNDDRGGGFGHSGVN